MMAKLNSAGMFNHVSDANLNKSILAAPKSLGALRKRKMFSFRVGYLRCDDVIANRVTHEFRNGVAIKFAHDIGAMSFRRFDA
jgi:hypothetical protein